MVKKTREATFVKIAGFVCNYPCSMSWDKGERTEPGRLVKYKAFWDGELVQSMRLDADAQSIGRLCFQDR